MPNRLAFTQHKEELQTPRRLRQSLTYRQSCPFLQGLPKQLYFFFPFNFFLVWILNIVISESSDVLKNFPLFYKLLDLWVFPVLCYFEILVLSPFSYPFLWFLSANYSFSRFYIFVFSCSFSAFFSNSRNFTRFRVILHFSRNFTLSRYFTRFRVILRFSRNFMLFLDFQDSYLFKALRSSKFLDFQSS